MGFHCNREVTKTDDKKMASLARNSLMTDLGLTIYHCKDNIIPRNLITFVQYCQDVSPSQLDL